MVKQKNMLMIMLATTLFTARVMEIKINSAFSFLMQKFDYFQIFLDLL